MSNSGIIAFKDHGTALGLRWNGGRDSVEAFLEYARLKGLPWRKESATASLATIITNFFGNDGRTLSLIPRDVTNDALPSDAGFVRTHDDLLDAYDNGLYVVNGWRIVQREKPDWGNDHVYIEQDEYDRVEMLKTIDQAQPEDQQLTAAFLEAPEVSVSDLRPGDKVWLFDDVRRHLSPQIHEIVGIGGLGRQVNGHNVSWTPYIGKYCTSSVMPEDNINNYLRMGSVRVSRP